MPATITKLCSAPHMVRFTVFSNWDDQPAKLTLTQLTTLGGTYGCSAGPLRNFLLSKTATWGTLGAAPNIASGNPQNDARFTVIPSPLAYNASGSYYGGAISVNFFLDGAANTMEILGSIVDSTQATLSVIPDFLLCGVVELRFEHSSIR